MVRPSVAPKAPANEAPADGGPMTKMDTYFSVATETTETAQSDIPASKPDMKAFLEALKSAQASADGNNNNNNNKFRVDFGSGDFMHGGSGSTDSKMSEKEKFIARMNAARSPKKEKSWDDDYSTICSSSAYLDAESMPFDSSDPDPGWAWAAERLDACQHGPYPGGFSADEEGWRLLRVEFGDLAEPVRKYYEAHPANGKLCVIDGVALFPPGVVLEWLPLFASTGDECEGKFNDLERYGKDVGGERVGGSIMGKSEIGSSVRVQVKADLMRRKATGKDEL